MKVSIAIATYNRAELIGKSLESVLNQTYTNIELIVVDDGSNDDTASVVQHYIDNDSRVRYVTLSTNQGATIARNRGIAEATGDLIMVWDSDDELYLHAIEQVVDKFIEDPELGIVSAPCKQYKKDGSEKAYRSVPAGEVQLSQIVCKYLPDNEKVRIAKSDIFKQVRYEARNIDFMVNGYLAALGKWYHLDEELGILHLQLDDVSLTTNRKRPNVKRSVERVEPLLRYFAEFGDVLKQNCPKRYAALCYGVSIGLLLLDRKTEARNYAAAAVRFDKRLLRYRLFRLCVHTPFARQLMFTLMS